MEKLRVLFPYVEAGFGHIMPMRSMETVFREKYSDRCEVISARFYADSENAHLVRYEKMLARQVRMYNRFPAIGHLATGTCAFFGSTLSSFGSMKLISPFAYRAGVKRLGDFAPDVVFSTHWATNYYAAHLKQKPLTVMYCPDARLNALFEYSCDLCMISMPGGYEQAQKKGYSRDTLKLVPFLIRQEAFSVDPDKRAARAALGLPQDRFTVLFAEGGYGIGKMTQICQILIRQHVPLTLIPVCGKNEKLYRYFSSLTPSREVCFRPRAFAEDMLQLEAAADLFCGKSGNILAEATFFGNPSLVTGCTSGIETYIAAHYTDVVGSAIKELSASKAAELILQFARDPSILLSYRRHAEAYHSHFGGEAAADALWEKIAAVFPDRI